MIYQKTIKNVFDFFVAGVLFIFSIPVLILICFLLAVSFWGNPIFVQERVGKNNKVFRILKFRTMNNKKDKNGGLLSDYERLTFLGSLIRKLSLDEVPQLLNVIRGDMSLVGPRPLLVEYLPLYSKEQSKRHTVRPGITGWVQVNGRNAVDWATKFKLDVYYVENISIALDLKILWMTVMKVFKSEGISSGTSVTMEKFKGQQ